MKHIYNLNINDIYENIKWGKLSSVVYAYVEITNKCNSNCIYCQKGESNSLNMSFSDYVILIDQLLKLNLFEIRLGGGEPLCDDGIIKKIEYARKKGFSVWVCTNGQLLTKKRCIELKSSGLLGVRISLDSLTPEIHNFSRGSEYSWFKTLQGIINAKQVGLEVIISMTVGKFNIDEIDKVNNFCKRLDLKFSTHFIMPVGKGKNSNFNEFDNSSLEKLINNSYGEKHCVAGTEMISIDTYGNVSPCSFIKGIYNFKELEIIEIMKKNDFKKYLNPVPKNKCKDCFFKSKKTDCLLSDICKGGCWALYEESITS
ncbi:MAG: radical SAM protein [Bacilli bacterium]|nr:radical SAM protein [Bacilli bacterium]